MSNDNLSPRELEEMADEMLADDAKSNGTTLYREGILDRRRQAMIRRREIPLSLLERRISERRNND